MQVTGDYVRDAVHAFNERGFEVLDPKWACASAGVSVGADGTITAGAAVAALWVRQPTQR